MTDLRTIRHRLDRLNTSTRETFDAQPRVTAFLPCNCRGPGGGQDVGRVTPITAAAQVVIYAPGELAAPCREVAS